MHNGTLDSPIGEFLRNYGSILIFDDAKHCSTEPWCAGFEDFKEGCNVRRDLCKPHLDVGDASGDIGFNLGIQVGGEVTVPLENLGLTLLDRNFKNIEGILLDPPGRGDIACEMSGTFSKSVHRRLVHR